MKKYKTPPQRRRKKKEEDDEDEDEEEEDGTEGERTALNVNHRYESKETHHMFIQRNNKVSQNKY